MKLFTLSAVILGLVTLTQHANAEVFVFTPPIEHPDLISISPRIESQIADESLKIACKKDKLQLVTDISALNNHYKSRAI
ncbi:hypothetical protein BGZ97_010425, partial [Linnemannia gamsii]